MKQKGCPFRNRCSACKIKELREEKKFIRDHCESDKQEKWRECVYYQIKEKSKKKNEDLFSSE